MSRRNLTLLLVLVFLALQPASGRNPTSERTLDWDEVVQPESEQPLRWPVAVAATADELVVADAYGSRLVIIARQSGEWKQVREISLDGTPYSLAYDGTRYAVSLRRGAGLMALEGEHHQLRKIALPTGAMPGALAGLPGGGFLVYDQASGDVLRLNAAGAAAGRWPVDGPVTGLATAPNGGFFATVAHRGEVLFYGANGQELKRWKVPGASPVPAWPTGIVMEPGGNLFIVDRHGGTLLEMGVGGRLEGKGSRRGWDPGLLRFPGGIALLPDGRLAVADQGNGRVQLFRQVSEESTP